MTRSVDHQDQRSFIGSQGQSSVFGTSTQGTAINTTVSQVHGGVVTARMHLNKNTTLELIDTTSNQSARKHMSPFSVKAAERRKFCEERGKAVQEQILKKYDIAPFNAPQTAGLIGDSQDSSSRVHSSRKRSSISMTPANLKSS